MTRRFGHELLDGHVAVSDAATDDVVLLNWTASAIWLALAEGPLSHSELDELIAPLCGDVEAWTELDAASVLEDWARAGWTARLQDGRWRLSEENAAPSARLPIGATVEWRIDAEGTHRLGSTLVRLAFGGSDTARMQGFFSGLTRSDKAAQARFVMVSGEQGYLLDLAGERASAADIAEATALLFDALLAHAYPDAGDFVTLHAAAVADQRGAILFPAGTGSGKTTLAAWLVAHGWRYGGDDVMAVGWRNGALEILPLPSALGIKEGSVDVLASSYPGLRAVPLIGYGDKNVRFMPVVAARHIPDDAMLRRPRAVVLPGWERDAACALTPISETEALSAMLAAGSGAGRGVAPETFSVLADLVRSVPRFRLTYGQLADAQALLEGLP